MRLKLKPLLTARAFSTGARAGAVAGARKKLVVGAVAATAGYVYYQCKTRLICLAITTTA